MNGKTAAGGAPGAQKVDGRRERSKRTHAAIVAALTALLDEGRIEPTAAQIAARAGVARRSIAQHFGSREELLLAVASHHAARMQPAALDPRAPLDERIRRLVEARSRTLEASMAMRRAAAVVLAHSPGVALALERAARERRDETAVLFAREIAGASEPEAVEHAIALATSGRAWDALRGEMGLAPAAARRQVAYLLDLALRPQSPARPRRR